MNNAKILPVSMLTPLDRDRMYSLLATHFDGVNLATFEADLNQKNWVLLLEKDNQLQGFSTLIIYQLEWAGETLNVVYSGDTIVAPSAWSSSILSPAWIASVKQLRQNYPQGKLYWLLICSGYRTYRFLPTFWQEFYPRYDAETPEATKQLMEFIAQERFGECYDSKNGIVRFPKPQSLGEKLRGIPENRLSDSHVRFFHHRNPNHQEGDELVCLTEVSEDNLTPAGRRMWFTNSISLTLCGEQ